MENQSKPPKTKKIINLQENLSLLLVDSESKTDSEQRDAILQLQVNKLGKKVNINDNRITELEKQVKLIVKQFT